MDPAKHNLPPAINGTEHRLDIIIGLLGELVAGERAGGPPPASPAEAVDLREPATPGKPKGNEKGRRK